MTTFDKKQAARKLLELRRLFGSDALPDNIPENARQLAAGHMAQLRELIAEVYAERYSEEQLTALLDLYDSDLGKSIIDTDEQIAVELEKRLSIVAKALEADLPERSHEITAYLEPYEKE